MSHGPPGLPQHTGIFSFNPSKGDTAGPGRHVFGVTQHRGLRLEILTNPSGPALSWSLVSALSVSATLADTRRIATRRNFDTKTWSGPSRQPGDYETQRWKFYTTHNPTRNQLGLKLLGVESVLWDILARLKMIYPVVLIMLICGVLLQVPRVLGIISLPAVQGSSGPVRPRQASLITVWPGSGSINIPLSLRIKYKLGTLVIPAMIRFVCVGTGELGTDHSLLATGCDADIIGARSLSLSGRGGEVLRKPGQCPA